MSQDDLNIIVNDGDTEELSEEGQAIYLLALQIVRPKQTLLPK
jgi:hypothetical protein